MPMSVPVVPSVSAPPKWRRVSLEFDVTQFSILASFEKALATLVGDAIHQFRPENTMNAAIITLVRGSRDQERSGYAYRWYRIGTVGDEPEGMQNYMHFPRLFGMDGKLGGAGIKEMIEGRRPFLFKQPVTLACAFLHHELQRRQETAHLLCDVVVNSDAQFKQLQRHWHHLDEDKERGKNKDFVIIDEPGVRYPKLHTETFQRDGSNQRTVATFIKPLIERDVLLGLFCVDVAEEARGTGGSRMSEYSLTQFAKGLGSLGVGIEATLTACGKAYYTHLDRPAYQTVEFAESKPVRSEDKVQQSPEGDSISEVPVLSAAFLEAWIEEVRGKEINELMDCPVAYLFFDNNDLKKVNTAGNYDCGTEIIRGTGQWISRGIETWATGKIDTEKAKKYPLLYDPQSWVVRWGGDEFIAIVAGGGGNRTDWKDLLECVRKEVDEGRQGLESRIGSLESLKGRSDDDVGRLRSIVQSTSLSVGGVTVDRINFAKNSRFDGTFEAFLREARIVAEERMKLVKDISKLGAKARALLQGPANGLKVEFLGDTLFCCYGGVDEED